MKHLFLFLLLLIPVLSFSQQGIINLDGEEWVSLLDPGKGKYAVDTEGWVAEGSNTIARIAEGDGAFECTFVDNDKGAELSLNAAGDLSTNLTIGTTYRVKVRGKRNAVGDVQFRIHDGVGYNTTVTLTTSYAWYYMFFTAQHATNCFMNFGSMSAGKVATVDEWDICEYNKGIIINMLTH